jgi:hypothetical protein
VRKWPGRWDRGRRISAHIGYFFLAVTAAGSLPHARQANPAWNFEKSVIHPHAGNSHFSYYLTLLPRRTDEIIVFCLIYGVPHPLIILSFLPTFCKEILGA